ncbi:hypothetical protein AALO_G00212960, partial [Alosa alosa]
LPFSFILLLSFSSPLLLCPPFPSSSPPPPPLLSSPSLSSLPLLLSSSSFSSPLLLCPPFPSSSPLLSSSSSPLLILYYISVIMALGGVALNALLYEITQAVSSSGRPNKNTGREECGSLGPGEKCLLCDIGR